MFSHGRGGSRAAGPVPPRRKIRESAGHCGLGTAGPPEPLPSARGWARPGESEGRIGDPEDWGSQGSGIPRIPMSRCLGTPRTHIPGCWTSQRHRTPRIQVFWSLRDPKDPRSQPQSAQSSQELRDLEDSGIPRIPKTPGSQGPRTLVPECPGIRDPKDSQHSEDTGMSQNSQVPADPEDPRVQPTPSPPVP